VDPVGGAVAAEVSPDGTKVAVVGREGLKVFPVDGEGEVIHTSFTAEPSQVTWSSDSRFVPLVVGLIFIDTVESGRTYEDLASHHIRAVAVIPLTGS
jgi:hypothetical protein